MKFHLRKEFPVMHTSNFDQFFYFSLMRAYEIWIWELNQFEWSKPFSSWWDTNQPRSATRNQAGPGFLDPRQCIALIAGLLVIVVRCCHQFVALPSILLRILRVIVIGFCRIAHFEIFPSSTTLDCIYLCLTLGIFFISLRSIYFSSRTLFAFSRVVE